jgi:hypothetical protein
MIALLKPVHVEIQTNDGVVYQDGVVIGRTREQRPLYDVRLASGAMLRGVEAELLEEAA